ncbi:hypothetical protein ACFE04_030960 [Oxalis oulophora]
MRPLRTFLKTHSSSRLINFTLIASSSLIVYILVSAFIFQTSTLNSSLLVSVNAPTTLEHIVFGIASNIKSWPSRKELVSLWWKSQQMRGCVFLDRLPGEGTHADGYNNNTLPPICISEDTSRFRYTKRNGLRSAIRVARVVLETISLNHSDVRWFVFGDDDTVFVPENLAKTLSKYDHNLWYYIGTNSEVYEQNRIFSFNMAFGGGGFAISYPLAKVLAKIFDSCIERYPHVYGSDSRIYYCLAELGVGLTHEPGFHQFDVRGDTFGLFASHPVEPLVSLHHVHAIKPIFPNMKTSDALRHFFKAVKADPERILQQTVCYDRWFSWTISVSWGYAVQVFGKHILLGDVLPVQETFRPWKERPLLAGVFTFNTKKVHGDPCQRPTIFYFDEVYHAKNRLVTTYKKAYANCTQDGPRKFEMIRVFSQKLDLSIQQLKAPRRQCCNILHSSSSANILEIDIRECKEDELINIHQ